MPISLWYKILTSGHKPQSAYSMSSPRIKLGLDEYLKLIHNFISLVEFASLYHEVWGNLWPPLFPNNAIKSLWDIPLLYHWSMLYTKVSRIRVFARGLDQLLQGAEWLEWSQNGLILPNVLETGVSLSLQSSPQMRNWYMPLKCNVPMTNWALNTLNKFYISKTNETKLLGMQFSRKPIMFSSNSPLSYKFCNFLILIMEKCQNTFDPNSVSFCHLIQTHIYLWPSWPPVIHYKNIDLRQDILLYSWKIPYEIFSSKFVMKSVAQLHKII